MSAGSTPPSEHPDDEYVEFARAAFEHRECRDKAEELAGGIVTVVIQPREPDHACPHGVRYWSMPAAWRKT